MVKDFPLSFTIRFNKVKSGLQQIYPHIRFVMRGDMTKFVVLVIRNLKEIYYFFNDHLETLSNYSLHVLLGANEDIL